MRETKIGKENEIGFYFKTSRFSPGLAGARKQHHPGFDSCCHRVVASFNGASFFDRIRGNHRGFEASVVRLVRLFVAYLLFFPVEARFLVRSACNRGGHRVLNGRAV